VSAKARAKIPFFEWVAAAFGAVLLVGIMALLVVDAIDGDAPPRITATVISLEPSGDAWRLDFLAENHGDRNASEVTFVVEGLGTTVVIDNLPGRSRRRAGFFLGTDPGGRKLTVRATSYVEP
jgi:uncharacterized protein (TIGR02588 family)